MIANLDSNYFSKKAFKNVRGSFKDISFSCHENVMISKLENIGTGSNVTIKRIHEKKKNTLLLESSRITNSDHIMCSRMLWTIAKL